MSEIETLDSLVDWCRTARHKIGAVDGYDYRSGEEAGLADAQGEIEKRLKALRACAPETFQYRVRPWMLACFGPIIPFDKTERNHRFLEEALELVQSIGCTQSEAHQLVDYVFGREIGETPQEVGGVMVTLAALCEANELDMAVCGEAELARIWTKVEKIRAKQAAKPKHSPLPEATRTTASNAEPVALPRFIGSYSNIDPRIVQVRFSEPLTINQHAEIAKRMMATAPPSAGNTDAVREALEDADRVLEQALDCILGETPEDMTPEEAREDTVAKILTFMRTDYVAALSSAPVAGATPPDWKQDQAETSRLPRHERGVEA